MTVTNLARSVLFGKKNAQTITFNSVAKSTLYRAIGWDAAGMPGAWDYAKHLGSMAIASMFGIMPERDTAERLPAGWPVDVFRIAAKEIATKGGMVKLPEGQVIPAFRLVSTNAQVLPHVLVAMIKGEGDYDRVLALGDAIREALAQQDKRLTVRVVPFPLRIEIDRPDPKVVKLADVWAYLKSQKRNEYEYATGFYYLDGKLRIGMFNLFDAREWSGIIAGAAGSGKSQFCLSMLLSMALNTSPDLLSLVIGDPKCADILALNGLPHLAYGRILSDIDEIRTAVKAVEAEMDRRIAARDKSIVRKRIVFFLDEWADIASLDTDGTITAAVARIGLKGRFWGLNIFLASQKTTSAVLSTLILANLAVRFCLRVGSFDEAKFISGQSGCYAHRLPGNGSMLVYNPFHNEGLREQGFYIGNPADPDFDETVGAYVADVVAAHGNTRPHWTVSQPAPELAQDELPMLPVAEEKRSKGRPAGELPDGFLDAIDDEEDKTNKILTVYGIRKLHKSLYGKGLNIDRAKRLYFELNGVESDA